MTTPAMIFVQHSENVGAFYEENMTIVNGQEVLREGAIPPAMPEGILQKGVAAQGQEFIASLTQKLSIGYKFTPFTFEDYAPHIHYLFASSEEDWKDVDAAVYVFEELNEDGLSYFADGKNPDAHWSSKLLLVITSTVIGASFFKPNAEGLEDLEPAFVIDRDEDELVYVLENVDDEED